MLNHEAEATSNIDPFVFKAVWLQKLDLPVDLDDLKPLPDSIRKSFEISPESLFKSTTIINTKSISSTSTSTSSNQSSNTMIGSKDGKAMVKIMQDKFKF